VPASAKHSNFPLFLNVETDLGAVAAAGLCATIELLERGKPDCSSGRRLALRISGLEMAFDKPRQRVDGLLGIVTLRFQD